MQIKENIIAPHHWPLWGEFTGDRWSPAQRASNTGRVFLFWRYHPESVSIWWRHHGVQNHLRSLQTNIVSVLHTLSFISWKLTTNALSRFFSQYNWHLLLSMPRKPYLLIIYIAPWHPLWIFLHWLPCEPNSGEQDLKIVNQILIMKAFEWQHFTISMLQDHQNLVTNAYMYVLFLLQN